MAETIQEVRPPEPPPKPPEVPRQTEPRADQGRDDHARESQSTARDETAAALRAEHEDASGDEGGRSLADGKDSLRPTPEFQAGLDQAKAAKDERAEGATLDPPSRPEPASDHQQETPEQQREADDHEATGHRPGAQPETHEETHEEAHQAAGQTAAREHGEATGNPHDSDPAHPPDETVEPPGDAVQEGEDQPGAADQTDEADAAAERTDKIHSRYPDGVPVYEGEQPGKIREPDPAAEGAPHTVLKMDSVNDRVYKAREYGEEGVPVRDIDFTHPTYPNGTLRPDHTAPEQHLWIPNDPDNPRAGFKRGPGEPLDS